MQRDSDSMNHDTERGVVQIYMITTPPVSITDCVSQTKYERKNDEQYIDYDLW